MITIKNTQRRVAINTEQLAEDTQKLLDALGYGDFDIGIWITTDQTMRSYNKRYRHKDHTTNILSFPYHADIKPGDRINPMSPEDKNLGDLLLSAAYIQREARELKQPLAQHLRMLLIHGVCHLLGYDHDTSAQYTAMNAEEQRLAKLLA